MNKKNIIICFLSVFVLIIVIYFFISTIHKKKYIDIFFIDDTITRDDIEYIIKKPNTTKMEEHGLFISEYKNVVVCDYVGTLTIYYGNDNKQVKNFKWETKPTNKNYEKCFDDISNFIKKRTKSESFGSYNYIAYKYNKIIYIIDKNKDNIVLSTKPQ